MALGPIGRRDPRVRVAQAYASERRIQRHPEHRFRVEYKPWTLQPFMLAPVLPGETLKNLLLQSRAVTSPLKPEMRVTGWWIEYWFFYVKHRDLPEGPVRDVLTQFVVDPGTDLTSIKTAVVRPELYTFAGAVDWMQLCLEVITKEYFREENEQWNQFMIDNLPQVAIWSKGHNDWTDGLTLNAAKRIDYLDVGLDDAQNPSQFEEAWAHWQALRESGLVQMDYQDFINTYGSETREAETSPNLHRPEIVRYIREWQYPTNIVEPTTGVPSTAVSWSTAERADKAFRFSEPGFLVGLTTARPKQLHLRQAGSAAGMLDNMQAWLPAVLNDHYELAYKQYAYNAGPLPQMDVSTSSYWVDLRDLFMHGDQFIRSSTGLATDLGWTATTPGATSGNRAYAAHPADTSSLFVGTTDATRCISCDGTVHLSIAGHQRDRTPGAPI